MTNSLSTAPHTPGKCENVFRIVHFYSLILYFRLAAVLLRTLCQEEQVREYVKIYDGVPMLLSILHYDNLNLIWNVVRTRGVNCCLYFVSPWERLWCQACQRVFLRKMLVIACAFSHTFKKESWDWRINDALSDITFVLKMRHSIELRIPCFGFSNLLIEWNGLWNCCKCGGTKQIYTLQSLLVPGPTISLFTKLAPPQEILLSATLHHDVGMPQLCVLE